MKRRRGRARRENIQVNDSKARRWLLVILFAAMAASSNGLRAGGMDDAKAGLSALDEKRYSDAIRLFTKAINSDELSGRQLASMYYGRGLAYAETHRLDLAIAD